MKTKSASIHSFTISGFTRINMACLSLLLLVVLIVYTVVESVAGIVVSICSGILFRLTSIFLKISAKHHMVHLANIPLAFFPILYYRVISTMMPNWIY
jgi:hypothetical protein